MDEAAVDGQLGDEVTSLSNLSLETDESGKDLIPRPDPAPGFHIQSRLQNAERSGNGIGINAITYKIVGKDTKM